MKAKELLPLLRLHGRTVFDEEAQALFFNWTCTGFTVRFRGKVLRAHLTALGDLLPPFPGMPQLPPDYPWRGVVPDGGKTAARHDPVQDPLLFCRGDAPSAGSAESGHRQVFVTARTCRGDRVAANLSDKWDKSHKR